MRNFKVENFLFACIYQINGLTPKNIYQFAKELNVDYYNLTELVHHFRNYDEYFNTPFTELEGGDLC